MSAQHSPSPWSVVGREVHNSDEGVIVARVPEWGIASDRVDRSEANARLIASAPDLLNALRLIEHATAPTHEDGAYHENAYELARAAIAKATGSTS